MVPGVTGVDAELTGKLDDRHIQAPERDLVSPFKPRGPGTYTPGKSKLSISSSCAAGAPLRGATPRRPLAPA
jgi:hypothetical protein